MCYYCSASRRATHYLATIVALLRLLQLLQVWPAIRKVRKAHQCTNPAVQRWSRTLYADRRADRCLVWHSWRSEALWHIMGTHITAVLL